MGHVMKRILLIYFALQVEIIAKKITFPELNVYEMSVNSDISSRYARTTVVKKVKNDATMEGYVLYSAAFPEEAYVTAFIIEIDQKNYTAHVTGRSNETKEGESTNRKAASSSSFDERDSNRVALNMTLKPNSKMAFYLTYEQLLKRQNGHYEHIINLPAGQSIKHFEVRILENNKIIDLQTSIFLCKGINCNTVSLKTTKPSNNKATIKPNISQIATILKSDNNQNLSGQFVLKYDVERDTKGGDILQKDGYCVHYFAPKDLTPLSKYIVFILDTSGSMNGLKIQLLKDAMNNILDELRDYDLFSVIDFNWKPNIWNIDSKATKENIGKAKTRVSSLIADGATNMFSALEAGLNLIEKGRKQVNNIQTSIIVFLTDGDPTDKTTNEIVDGITELNVDLKKSSILTIGFGKDTDYTFLNLLAERNQGFTKRVDEASDASINLQAIYGRISSPVLTNVTFQYDATVLNLTRTKFPTFFNGSELVVSGKCGSNNHPNVVVEGWANDKRMTFIPDVVESPPTETDVKRIWVNVEISQAFEDAIKIDNSTKQKEVLDKAYNLALQNTFATKLTSLAVPDLKSDALVIKPENDKESDEIPFPEYTPTVYESWISSGHQSSLHGLFRMQQLLMCFTITFRSFMY